MKVAVYCSAKDMIPAAYLALGDELGAWVAAEGHTLVYGGATGGLMTRVSDAVKASGGKVVGVIPRRIIEAKRMATNCDTLYVVANMSARKQLMRTVADCFVCLPGSYGTLDEMMDVIASGTVHEHTKPIFVLNHEGFYEGLKQQAEHMRALHFLPKVEQCAPQFVDSMDELKERIQNLTIKN
jgi:uncharacterized protein (TIGR00730 family)